ncbi:uncharacterized protein LOC125061507 [Pieris napi]|uniref:uncharacterized protein LOC125061507 n=1 Tax=Pieris napi TaxID=78633 RepID=UPI001FBA0FF6|nr:uncharacterized protein LOC125061507 [Pieris napi]
MDDEDEVSKSLYESGHWVWNEEAEELEFISDLRLVEESLELLPTSVANVEFKDDIDLLEQQKFRKYLQRKTEEIDFVTLQDVKDVVLFTAPLAVMSSSLIKILHHCTTERFLRALTLYTQYYLQISDEMSHRTLELETKIRTENSDKIEMKYRKDLEDLRLLVAKEYCIIILGEGSLAKYHHMGVAKTGSLSKKDAVLFETLVRFSIQIVWIALGRVCYNQIEVEIHRLFKSEIFNSTEHKLNINYYKHINERERCVLLGHCVNQGQKLTTRSPLQNEVFCPRYIDFRQFGIGTMKYPGLSNRLRLLEIYLTQPEQNFAELRLSIGILGLPRSKFDIMLREIKSTLASAASSSSGVSRNSIAHRASRQSRTSRKSIGSVRPEKLYPDIHLPEQTEITMEYDTFPEGEKPHVVCHKFQRAKWLRFAATRRKNKHKK